MPGISWLHDQLLASQEGFCRRIGLGYSYSGPTEDEGRLSGRSHVISC